MHSKKVTAVPVHEFDKDVEAVIRTVESKLGSDIVNEQKRFFAIKLLEKDDKDHRADEIRSGCICRDQTAGRQI